MQQYLKDHPRKCRIVMTGDTNLAAMYAANRYPIYVVVDREGKIVDTQRGSGGERRLRRSLARAGLESERLGIIYLQKTKRPPAGGLFVIPAKASSC